jgi:hypothetical protein
MSIRGSLSSLPHPDIASRRNSHDATNSATNITPTPIITAKPEATPISDSDVLRNMFNMIQGMASRLDKLEAGHLETKTPEVQAPVAPTKPVLPRAERVLKAAHQANSATLGLDADQMAMFTKFLSKAESEDTDIEDQVHSTPHTYLSSDLFPLRYDESSSLEEALKLAMNSRSRTTRRFPSFDKMQDAFCVQFDACIQADGGTYGTRARAFRQYEQFVIRLFATRGLDMAQDYHFRLFDLIAKGRHDLVKDGYFSAELMLELSARPAGRKTGGGSRVPFRTSIPDPCQHHGPESRHTWAVCRANPANAGRPPAAKGAATASGGKQ